MVQINGERPVHYHSKERVGQVIGAFCKSVIYMVNLESKLITEGNANIREKGQQIRSLYVVEELVISAYLREMRFQSYG